MNTTRLALLALMLVLSPLAASAQESASDLEMPRAAQAPATRTPSWRLDVTLPSIGIGWFTAPTGGYDQTIVAAGTDVRLVSSSGHGGMLRAAYGSNGWGGALAVETDYVFRARLVGDDRFGLGLDTTVGTSLAWFSHNEGTIPTGLALGGNVGGSIDFRAYGFVVSLGAQYRILIPTDGALNGGPSGAEHAFTATLGLGFGFWGA